MRDRMHVADDLDRAHFAQMGRLAEVLLINARPAAMGNAGAIGFPALDQMAKVGSSTPVRRNSSRPHFHVLAKIRPVTSSGMALPCPAGATRAAAASSFLGCARRALMRDAGAGSVDDLGGAQFAQLALELALGGAALGGRGRMPWKCI